MKKIITILILCCLLLPLAAEKSAAKAMLFSAIIPGSGQAYLGSRTKAGIFFTTELLALGATLRLNNEVSWAEDSYEQMAYSNAGLPLDSSKDIYQKAQNYISSADYNHQMQEDAWAYFVLANNDLESYYAYVELNRIPESESWDWVTNTNWQQYKDKRRYRQDMETYSNLALAAVVVNHIIGLIDTALLRAELLKEKTQIGNFYLDPDFKKKGVKIGYVYKF